MKKSVGVLLIGFFILGIFMSSFFVLADDNSNAGSGNGAIGNVSGNASGSMLISPRKEQEMNQGDNNQIRNQAQVHQHVEGEYNINGTRVQTQREVQTEDGKTTVQIQKTFTYANGTQVQVQVQIETENKNGTITRQINIEREGESYNASISKDLNVSDEFIGNQSRIVARLSNGQNANVSVLPDQALNATLARLRIREREINNGTNVSIQLRERIHNNVPQVVYNVQANQTGRFLGIFKIALRSNTEVDASNGEVVSVQRPWWAFLVAVPQNVHQVNNTNSS